jgi:hypothetical protein
MLRSTVERRTSTRQIARQTRRQHDISPSLPILVLPQMVDRKLHSIVRCCKVHIIHPSIRLLQLALLIQLIFKKLIFVFCYARVDKNVVDCTEPLDAGFESFALAVPVGEIALQGENAFRFEQ